MVKSAWLEGSRRETAAQEGNHPLAPAQVFMGERTMVPGLTPGWSLVTRVALCRPQEMTPDLSDLFDGSICCSAHTQF